MVIEVGWLFRLPLLNRAAAVTVFRWIFVRPGYANRPGLIQHEMSHVEDQTRWAIWGLGVGLIVWWLLYLLFLPVGWNPLRRQTEAKAMRAEGRQPAEIAAALKRAPYYLWWM